MQIRREYEISDFSLSISNNSFLVSGETDHRKFIGNLKPVATFTYCVVSYSPFDRQSIRPNLGQDIRQKFNHLYAHT